MLSFGKVRRLQAQWGGTEGARGALLGMRTFREKLRGDLLALEQGGAIRRATVDEFNQLLAEHPIRSRLITPVRATRLIWFRSRAPQDLFAPIAYIRCPSKAKFLARQSKAAFRNWCTIGKQIRQ